MKIPIAGISGTRYCTVVLLVSYRPAYPSFGIAGKLSIVENTEPIIAGANVKINPYAITKDITEKPRWIKDAIMPKILPALQPSQGLGLLKPCMIIKYLFK